MVASLAMLIVLQSTNLWKTFSIESSSDLLLLYALSSLNFIAFVIFGFIFLRSIIRLARERRTFELGAKIKTRLLIYFFAVSLLPIIAMAVFSYLFMNRALERWFSQIPENTIRQAREMQRSAINDRARTLDASARMVASRLTDAKRDRADLESIAKAGNLSYIAVLGPNGQPESVFQSDIAPELLPELQRVIGIIGVSGARAAELNDGAGFDVGIAEMSEGRRLIIVPTRVDEASVSQIVDDSLRDFDRLREQQLTIRRVGLLTLGVLTFLLIFASSWIAFYVARGLTSPIKALAEGAGEIATGNLSHRVEVIAEDELAILVNAFNEMASQLDANAAQLSERQRYIETVLQTLPTGVVSIGQNEEVGTMNLAAAEMLGANTSAGPGSALADLTGEDEAVVLRRLVTRARRVGHASDQAVVRHRQDGNPRTLAITAALLPEDGGVVLVIEDLSELIAAQRASAWQEVARRMAHEIKNPLTPIQLSAERIAKRFRQSGHQENGTRRRVDDKAPIGDIVHESTETILREVASLKTMVDEFSRFARLPDVKLASGDVGEVIEQAIAAFDGRHPQVAIEFSEGAELPTVLLDPEQLKRVYVNLIDNSVEAFDPHQPEKVISITARYDVARDIVVSEVSDNGRGIDPADLQKLFQPYFSTKGRGTGLGLAIVKRVVTEHHGRINVVSNRPSGARFIIELPVQSN